MKKVFISCPPMLAEQEQIHELAEQFNLEAICADVVQTLTEQELSEVLPTCDGWIAGDDPGTRRVLTAGRSGSLSAVIKWGVGVDNIDQVAAADLGLGFANTPGMFNHEVADLAYGYLINLVRHIRSIDQSVRSGGWIKPQGTSLHGKTAGVVGLGNIGQEIIRRLNVSGVSVIGYDPYAKPHENYEIAEWPARLEECDFLLLCCALTEDNRHLINEQALSAAKEGLYLVNVSRGPLVDQAALLAALQSGRIAGAALDVFEQEPPATDDPLLRFDNCVFGSHNASNTREAVRATNARAMELLHGLLQD